jgi:hypothetical protein
VRNRRGDVVRGDQKVARRRRLQHDLIPGLPVCGNAQRTLAYTRPNMDSRPLQANAHDIVAAT